MKRERDTRGPLATIAGTLMLASLAIASAVAAFDHPAGARDVPHAPSHLEEQPCASTCPVHGHHGGKQETPR